jgi:hypothetical protein
VYRTRKIKNMVKKRQVKKLQCKSTKSKTGTKNRRCKRTQSKEYKYRVNTAKKKK